MQKLMDTIYASHAHIESQITCIKIIASGMNMLGIPAGNDLIELSDEIRLALDDVERALGEEIQDELNRSRAALHETFGAILNTLEDL